MDSKVTSYKPLFAQHEYMKLMAANLINRFGDSIDAIAFSWLMYEITQSAALMALIVGLNYLPTILLQPFTGALVENLSKKKVMVIFDIGRGVVVALGVLLYINNLLTPAMLIAMTLVLSTMEAFRIPAGSAIVPKILDKELYTVGTALNQSASHITELIGLAAAGGIVAWLGCEGALLIDVATFFLSALIIAFIKLKETIDKTKINVKDVWDSFKDGFSLVKTNRLLLVLMLIGALINFSMVPINAFSVAFISDNLNGTVEILSIVNILMVLGMGLGSFITPKITKMSDRIKLVVFGLVISFALILFAASAYLSDDIFKFGAAFLACFMLGLGSGVLNVVLGAAFMRFVPPEYMARLSGLVNAFLCCIMPIGSFMCSALSSVVEVPVAIIVAGGLSLILYLGILRVKSLKELK